MTPILIKDLGKRFPTTKSTYRVRYGLYKCKYCGREWEARISNINSGNTKSCGCTHLNENVQYNHRLYNTWNLMIQRCYNTKHPAYKDYGARGILVCEEWRYNQKQFVEDMFPSFVEGLSLDRIDNDKGYSKENCRWATSIQQAHNKRMMSNNTSGYIGVCWHTRDLVFDANIRIEGKLIFLGRYKTALEAAIVRNNYIIENNLPHKLNIIPEQEEEENIA